jgi:hypothetical protein
LSDFFADNEDASAFNAEAPLDSGAPFDAAEPSVDDGDFVVMVRERFAGGAT